MKTIKNGLWITLLLIVIDYLIRHLYGYRMLDVFDYFFNLSELLAH